MAAYPEDRASLQVEADLAKQGQRGWRLAVCKERDSEARSRPRKVQWSLTLTGSALPSPVPPGREPTGSLSPTPEPHWQCASVPATGCNLVSPFWTILIQTCCLKGMKTFLPCSPCHCIKTTSRVDFLHPCGYIIGHEINFVTFSLPFRFCFTPLVKLAMGKTTRPNPLPPSSYHLISLRMETKGPSTLHELCLSVAWTVITQALMVWICTVWFLFDLILVSSNTMSTGYLGGIS